MAAAFKPLMPLDEAWSRLHAAVVEHLGPTPRATDVVDSFDALGRVLAEDLVIRKLRFLETATEALERDERDSMRAEIDATFALMTGELKRLLQRLEKELSFSAADA